MSMSVQCPKGHNYIQADIYKDWPDGAPHCPECYSEWKFGDSKQINLSNFYVSRWGMWFDYGTVVLLLDDYSNYSDKPMGLFLGLVDGTRDEEVCNFDEFIPLEEYLKGMLEDYDRPRKD